MQVMTCLELHRKLQAALKNQSARKGLVGGLILLHGVVVEADRDKGYIVIDDGTVLSTVQMNKPHHSRKSDLVDVLVTIQLNNQALIQDQNQNTFIIQGKNVMILKDPNMESLRMLQIVQSSSSRGSASCSGSVHKMVTTANTNVFSSASRAAGSSTSSSIQIQQQQPQYQYTPGTGLSVSRQSQSHTQGHPRPNPTTPGCSRQYSSSTSPNEKKTASYTVQKRQKQQASVPMQVHIPTTNLEKVPVSVHPLPEINFHDILKIVENPASTGSATSTSTGGGIGGISIPEISQRIKAPWQVIGAHLEQLQLEGMVYCLDDRYFPL